MKRVISIVLSFILIFNLAFISFSYANTIDDLKDVEIGANIDNMEALNHPSGELEELIKANEAGLGGYEPSGLIAKILSWITDWFTLITNPIIFIIIALPTIDGCIFNTQSYFKLSFFDAQPKGLGASLQGSISAIYNAFRYLVTAVYIIILVYLAIRMMLSSVGRQKALYKELFKHWLIGLLLLFSFHWVMAFIIWISNTFVDILAELSRNLLDATTTLDESFAPLSNYPVTTFVLSRIYGANKSGLGLLLGVLSALIAPILQIIFIASTVSIIIMYFKRLFTVAVLILLFPLVALSYVFDKIGDRKAQTLGIWLKEFVVNVALQPIHAIILVFISLIYSTGAADNISEAIIGNNLFGPHLIGAIMSLVALRLLPLGEELLKKIFQINSNMGPGAQGIAGTMAKTGLALKGMKEMAGSIKKMGSSALRAESLAHGFRKIRNDATNDANKKFDRAYNEAKARGLSNREARKAGLEARKNSLDNNKDYQNFKKTLKEQTGSKSVAGARAKALAQVSAASFGVGTSVTGSGSGKFLSDAAYKAVLGASAVDAISKTPEAINKLRYGDLEKAEDYANRAKELSNKNLDLDKLDKDDKKKIAAELGIHVDMVNNKNRDKIVNAYHEMELPAKYGVNKDDIKKFSSLYKEQKNIEKGLTPDGSANLDLDAIDSKDKYRTNSGTFATIDGTTYKINNNGDHTLKDGEKATYDMNLKNQSVTNNSEVLLQTNSEYQGHHTKRSHYQKELEVANEELKLAENNLSEKSTNFKIAERNVTSLSAQQSKAASALSQAQSQGDANEISNAQAKYDEITSQLNTAQQELTTARAEQSSAKTQRSAAYSAVTNIENKISDEESSMKKIEKAEIQKQLSMDEAFVKLGSTPFYSDTAYELVRSGQKSGQIVRDSRDNASVTKVNLQGANTSYTIDISDLDGATLPVTLDANTRQSTIEFTHSIVMANNNTLNAQYNDAIKRLNTSIATGDPNIIQEARFNLANVEAQVSSAMNSQIAEFTANPDSVLDAGGSSAIRDLFQANGIIQEKTNSNFISTYTPTNKDAFSYGICAELANVLENYSNNSFTIQLIRTSPTTLSYSVFNKYTGTNSYPVATGTINIDSHFDNDALSTPPNSSITLVHTKDGWFVQ